MNHYLVTDFAFVGTTVDPSPVLQYLFNNEFKMLRYAQQQGMHPLAVATLDRMEWVGLQIRHYVAGYQKTLHRTLKEVRLFIRDYPHAAAALVPAIIAVLRDKFIKNEWYELLIRSDKAEVKISRLLATGRQTL